ncbi:MAG: rhomboid family intramembrane serine protease, partial [Candidatus Tectomicrobia bacterium]
MDSSLVLAAVDIDHHVESNGDEWCLYVPVEKELTALEELQSYQLENVPKIVHRPKVVTFDSGWIGVLGYLTVIWLLPSLEAASVFDLDWRGAGRMQAGLVMDGQWWRTITALTLHADLAHILANSLFGAVFGLFVGRYLGSGFGWLLVLLAGALGNQADVEAEATDPWALDPDGIEAATDRTEISGPSGGQPLVVQVYTGSEGVPAAGAEVFFAEIGRAARKRRFDASAEHWSELPIRS